MAATVASLRRDLSSYIRADYDFLSLLNSVLPRLTDMGLWKDLLVQYSVETDHGYVTLPWDADALIAANIQSYPGQLNSQWQDYRTVGSPSAGVSPAYGLVDDGYHPTISDLFGDETFYQLRLDTVLEAEDGRPASGQIHVRYRNEGGDLKRTTIDATTDSTTTLPTPNRIASIEEIRFDNVNHLVTLTADPVGTSYSDILVAEGRGDDVCRYRRFRLANPSSADIVVLMLLKRGFRTLYLEQDVVWLSDLNVVKHGILATIAEDNADIERANYHWGVCNALLEKQKDAVRGMIRISPNIDPTGGAGGPIPNLT